MLSHSHAETNGAIHASYLNAHQCGVLNRISRSILAATNPEEIINIVASAAESLSLSGCCKIEALEQRLSVKFGRGFSRSQCTELVYLTNCQGKVVATDHFLFFTTDNVFIVIDTCDLTELESELFKDNLTIFSDTLQTWIEQYSYQNKIQQRAKQERLMAADQMNDILTCLTRLNENLLGTHVHITEELISELVAKFPTMALEIDQEDNILNIVDTSVKKHQGIIDAQIKQNNDLKLIMAGAIEALTQEQKTSLSTQALGQQEINSVELF